MAHTNEKRIILFIKRPHLLTELPNLHALGRATEAKIPSSRKETQGSTYPVENERQIYAPHGTKLTGSRKHSAKHNPQSLLTLPFPRKHFQRISEIEENEAAFDMVPGVTGHRDPSPQSEDICALYATPVQVPN